MFPSVDQSSIDHNELAPLIEIKLDLVDNKVQFAPSVVKEEGAEPGRGKGVRDTLQRIVGSIMQVGVLPKFHESN